MHPMLIVAMVGGVLLLAAWGLWALVRHWDRTNAVLAAAPQLPIRLVNVWDPVWVRGDIECDAPCVIPYFHYTCVHFTYKLEELVRRTRTRNGKTEVYYEWVTRETKAGHAPFCIVQGEDSIGVDVARARWHYEEADSQTLGSWRHSCTYIRYPGVASVVGVVCENRRQLEPLKHVPLIVTPRERRSYLEAAESAERWTARAGLLLLFIGFCLAAFGLIRFSQTSDNPNADPGDVLAIILGIVAGLLAAVVFWMLRTYNSLVIFRTRADQSWSSINIHLKQRYDLIPNLVEVVKGYLRHEQGLLESLAAIRTRAVAAGMSARIGVETEAVGCLTRLAAVVERYPNLQADQQFRKLADQIVALEEKIAHARTFFNDSVKEYNVHTAMFPSNLVANAFGFQRYPMFSAELEEREPVRFALAMETPTTVKTSEPAKAAATADADDAAAR